VLLLLAGARGRLKILLVADDDALLSFLAKELENRGCDFWQRIGPVGVGAHRLSFLPLRKPL
jgi:hypothetical protein